MTKLRIMHRLLLSHLISAVAGDSLNRPSLFHQATRERFPSRAPAISSENAVIIVSTQSELTAALASGNTISLSNTIKLFDSGISIQGLTGVTIDGNGFKLDGQETVRCLSVGAQSEVTLINLIVAGGYTVRFNDLICCC